MLVVVNVRLFAVLTTIDKCSVEHTVGDSLAGCAGPGGAGADGAAAERVRQGEQHARGH